MMGGRSVATDANICSHVEFESTVTIVARCSGALYCLAVPTRRRR